MLRPHLGTNEDGVLTIGGLNTVELAEKYGTPLYVVDIDRILEKFHTFEKAFSKRWEETSIWYAYKANSNSAVCKALLDEGCGAEVGSLCELKLALDLGADGEEVTLNGNNKSLEELELAIKNNILINVDNLTELDLINKIAKNKGVKAQVGFRVNPDVNAPTHPHITTGLRESKFGLDVPSGKALKAYKRASEMENIIVESIHSHIGSQILDSEPFSEQARKSMELRNEIEKETDIEIETVNLGGGLGIPYRPNEKGLSSENFAESIVTTITETAEKTGSSKPKLAFEPGRFLVSDSTLLLGEVGYVKERGEATKWASIDIGMNGLIRPALYDSYHHIEIANKMNEEKKETINIAGPLCESGDFLGKGRKLPPVERGDLLAVYDAGAYGLAMSSQYNAHPRPCMIMIRKEASQIVREREKCGDITRLDKIPKWSE